MKEANGVNKVNDEVDKVSNILGQLYDICEELLCAWIYMRRDTEEVDRDFVLQMVDRMDGLVGEYENEVWRRGRRVTV